MPSFPSAQLIYRQVQTKKPWPWNSISWTWRFSISGLPLWTNKRKRKKERMSSTCIWCRRLRVNATLFSLPNDLLYTFSVQEETFREARAILSTTAAVAQYILGFTLQTRKCWVVKVAGMAVLLWTHLGTCRGPGWSRPGSPAWWGHRSWRRWAWLRCPGWRPSSWSPRSHQPWWYLRRRECPVKRWPLGSEKTSCSCLFGAYRFIWIFLVITVITIEIFLLLFLVLKQHSFPIWDQ